MNYFAEWLVTPDGVQRNRRLVVEHGRFAGIEPAPEGAAPGDELLPGVVFPGFANVHSHAFHRALRGRVQRAGADSFWTWRDSMYAVANTLDPDDYRRLATATFVEMALSGITCVGEFHYVHHRPNGQPYPEPNAMGVALLQAAAEAGIRITLLDACYLEGGLAPAGHVPLDPRQARFADASVAAWADRFASLTTLTAAHPHALAGAAIHSVRAVAAADLPVVVAASAGRVLHVHLSEQPAENRACLAHYGRTPSEVLDNGGALSPLTTVVHATHLSTTDLDLLAARGSTVCLCPTTERDLADGIGPAGELSRAGVPLALGSDQHAVLDLIEEARAVEMHERLRTRRRGTFSAADLHQAMTVNGHRSLGWVDAGAIRVGARADLVAVRRDTTRTAGVPADQLVFAATAADVHTVIIDGQAVVRDGRHLLLGDVTGYWRTRSQ